jgi:hypothetical protein
MGVSSGLVLPPLAAPTFPSAPSAAAPTPEFWSTPTSSANALHVLQSPAFYYYTAAVCSTQRKDRFQQSLAAEVSQSLDRVVADS